MRKFFQVYIIVMGLVGLAIAVPCAVDVFAAPRFEAKFLLFPPAAAIIVMAYACLPVMAVLGVFWAAFGPRKPPV